MKKNQVVLGVILFWGIQFTCYSQNNLPSSSTLLATSTLLSKGVVSIEPSGASKSILLRAYAYAPTGGTGSPSPSAPFDPSTTYPSPLQIGLAVGINYSPSANSDYYISPTDNTLQKDPISNTSFVGSVVVSYTPTFTYSYLSDPSVTPFKAPGWFSFLSSFNLAQLNTSTGFNTKFSGGLGLGVNIQNIFQIGLFVDFTQTQSLRQSIADSLGKVIMVNKIPVISLDQNDSRFYKSDFITSLSIKFIYNLTRRSSDVSTGVGKATGLQ